jgi:site-specific DNA recombinase
MVVWTDVAVATFGELMRQNPQEGATSARRAWLMSIVDRIVVDADAISLFGRNDALEQCVMLGPAATRDVRNMVHRTG